jgi:hypothetical protein
MRYAVPAAILAKRSFLLPRPDVTSVLASIVAGNSPQNVVSGTFSGIDSRTRLKSALFAIRGTPSPRSLPVAETISLSELPPVTPPRGDAEAQAERCKWAQVFAAQRVSIGRRLLTEAAAFAPFTLPSGVRVEKNSAALALGFGPQAPPATLAMPAAPAEQAMASFMPPAPIPAAGAVPIAQPGAQAGLTPGSPAAVPGHAALKSVIQTKGPISATGDFANPNAGQNVTKFARLRRLLARL